MHENTVIVIGIHRHWASWWALPGKELASPKQRWKCLDTLIGMNPLRIKWQPTRILAWQIPLTEELMG